MKFCRQCGSALAMTSPGAPAYGAPMMPPMAPAMAPPMAPPMAPVMAAPGLAPAGAALPSSGPAALPATMINVPAPQPLAPAPSFAGGPRPDARGPAMPAAQGSTINCPRCGTSTPLGFAYCQQCGLHMQGVVPTDVNQQRPRSPSQSPAVVVAVNPQVPIDPMAGTLAQPDAARAAMAGVRPLTPPPASTPPPVTGPAMPAPLAVVPRPPAGAAWGMAVLVNRDGSDGQRFQLSSADTLVGRAGADIVFDDDRFLAPQHARISRGADGVVTIYPLDSINGVFKKVDGPTELNDGAIVLLGREVLRYEKVAPEERQTSPLVRHGVSLFGSPPRDPWGRLLQLLPTGGYRDVRHLVGEEIVLGREEGDIVFRDDAFMSRRHAALTWDGTRARITDLGSSNGSFLRVTTPTVVKHGDHVRLGDQLLRIEK